MIWLINVDDQWKFSNSCIKFALAGWFVSSHVLEVERRFLLRSASRGGTMQNRFAQFLEMNLLNSNLYTAIPNMLASCHNILCAVRISCIWQRWRLQRKFFLCCVQCNVFEHVWTLNWNRSYQAHTLNQSRFIPRQFWRTQKRKETWILASLANSYTKRMKIWLPVAKKPICFSI